MLAAAKQNNITGWVRNRRDGTVEAIVQGTPAAIEQITNWAQQGPEGASVNQVADYPATEPEIYTDFTQQPTV
jgi:acylphosphatase